MIGPLIADPPDLPATLAALKAGKRNATKYRFADLAPELRAELAALLCRPPAPPPPPPPPAATEDKPEPPILARVRAAVAEGIGPNVRRFARFQGHAPGEVIELQAIGAKDKQFTVNWFAHATDVDTAIALAEMSERVDPAERSVGVYCIGNAVNPAVATRAPIGRWHRAKKGESTTDRDILARCEGFVDIDPERPGGTSATDEQHAEALAVGARIYTDVAAIVGEDACGLGDSGNGATFKFAVDRTAIEPACEAIIKEIIAALDALYSIKGRVKIDASLTDPKRLSPCWGTTKRKGVPGLPDRPHRPTGFVCSDNVRRLSMDELVKLRDTLAARLGGDRAKATDEPAPKAETRGNGPFDRANGLPPRDVATWLGIDPDAPVCPGCGSTDGTFLDHGFKCHHNRCAKKGPPGRPGFRTNVDLTMEARPADAPTPWEAVKLLGEQFGFSVDATADAPMESAIRAAWRALPADLFTAPAPPRPWLLRYPSEVVPAPCPGAGMVIPGEGLFPLGKAGLLVSDGGTGKTKTLAALAVSIVTGRPVFGHYVVPPEACGRRVLLALGEDDAEDVKRLLQGAARAYGLTDEEQRLVLARVVALPLAGHLVSLLEVGPDRRTRTASHELDAFREMLAADAGETGWGLIAIDTLARFADEEAEKDNAAATRFAQAVESLIAAAPGKPSVLVAHHASLDGVKTGEIRARGATGIRNAFRWEASLRPDGDDDVLFQQTKSNYSRRMTEPLRLVRIPGAEGFLRAASADEEVQRVAKAAKAAEEVAVKKATETSRRKDTTGAVRLSELVERIRMTATSEWRSQNAVAAAANINSRTEQGNAVQAAVARGVLEKEPKEKNPRYRLAPERAAETQANGAG